MKPRQIMIGLSGHVDHGKSALVQHLTGRNPQRHPEELKRGMTLDISVRPLALSDGTTVGIVDVPGHEDLVRNMVAGVTAIDIALIIVAADDGVMPQTIEHVRVLSLVEPRIVVPVITKIDLVDSDRLAQVRQDIEILLINLGIEPRSPHFVSNLTGSGIDELHSTLDTLAIDLLPSVDSRAPRMDVRHVFSVKGFGTVVTGVPISGTLEIDDAMELLPSGRKTAVRTLQNYHADVSSAPSHASVAICLREVTLSEVERGMVLCQPDVYAPSLRFVCKIRNFVPLRTRDRTEFLLHCGTQKATCHLRPIFGSSNNLEDTFYLVSLPAPIVVTLGDKIILRASGSEGTVAGGVVCAILKDHYRLKRSKIREGLDASVRFIGERNLVAAALATAHGPIVSLRYLCAASGLQIDTLRKQLTASNSEGISISLLPGELCLIHARAHELHGTIRRIVTQYHKDHRLVWGMKPSLLCSHLGISPDAFNVVWPYLKPDDVVLKFKRVARQTFSPALSKKQSDLRDRVLKLLDTQDLRLFAGGDVIRGLQVDPNDVEFALHLLIEEEEIVRLDGGYVISRRGFDLAFAKFTAIAKTHATVTLPAYRQILKLGRNWTVLLLDEFDSRGLTHRLEDNSRVLRS